MLWTITITITDAAFMGLAGCYVKKTQEGNVTLPKYEVEKTKEGNVTLPKYGVTAPDIKVTTTEKTIVVPTGRAEEKSVVLPNIEVTTGKEKSSRKQEVNLSGQALQTDPNTRHGNWPVRLGDASSLCAAIQSMMT
jgi:hypothetical protein